MAPIFAFQVDTCYKILGGSRSSSTVALVLPINIKNARRWRTWDRKDGETDHNKRADSDQRFFYARAFTAILTMRSTLNKPKARVSG